MPQIGFIEHQCQRPQPFSASGDMETIRKMFSMPEITSVEDFEKALLNDEAKVFTPKSTTCLITQWRCDTNFGAAPVYVVEATPVVTVQGDSLVSASSATPCTSGGTPPPVKTDPWVVAGTTTIDGSIDHVGGLLRVLSNASNEDAIDAFLHSDDPWLVGGRWLRARRSHCDHHANTAIIRCDIVRRQSEIDAEVSASWHAEGERIGRAYAAAHPSPPCPECGPHGNRGRVLLLESWIDCTSCHHDDVVPDGIHIVNEAPLVGSSESDTGNLPPQQAYDYSVAMIPGGIPRDILFGRAPSGFAAANKAELENYIARCRNEGTWR
jgi:hypothetical protein